ncbi:MAG: hypothetical protein BGO01_00110 [Armatimonadetes bacterium 55-13]|nr:winged helix-turn-helix transcriptional regulator [Armatimonadota bacterium]OJU63104.1 MAG: hypothetical protein BGO01_00110 [Armatimonadetes bacterium 55-13]
MNTKATEPILPHHLSHIAAALADPTRAEMITVMMDGRAYSTTALSVHVNIAPSTASHHLAVLTSANLVESVRSGRHTYHRLAGPEVAVIVESLAVFGSRKPPEPRMSKRARLLRPGRTCYDHLAGQLGVALRRGLESRNWLRQIEDRYELSSDGERRLRELGVNWQAPALSRRCFARACLDWTERVPHIGGTLGAALFACFVERKWIANGPVPRQVELTPLGQEAWVAEWGLALPTNFDEALR